jgi:hypothetical protein
MMGHSSQRHKLEVHGINARGERPPWLSVPLTPTVAVISPASAPGNAGMLTIMVFGDNYTPTSIITFDAVDAPTTFVNSGQLDLTFDTTGFVPNTHQIAVRNDALVSNSRPFTFT